MLEGVVLSNKSNLYKVELNNEVYDCMARGKIKSEDVSPVAGDLVEFEITDCEKKAGVINKILPRKNYLKRPKMANLSQIIFVVSMKLPKPDLLLLDKQLVYAEFNEIKPIIVLNKTDLVEEELVHDIERTYSAIGYTVIKTNAQSGDGVDEIKKHLKNNITAFSGNSGVGKSTLINKILNREVTAEGELSKKNKRGKNTTTQVTLYKIEDNSYIADTPGFSTFEISELDSKELAQYFVEFRPYIEECEYGDCGHIKEENCGIKKAVQEGKIPKERYSRYVQIKECMKDKLGKEWKEDGNCSIDIKCKKRKLYTNIL